MAAQEIILNGTTDSVAVVTSAAGNVDVYTAYVDTATSSGIATGSPIPGRNPVAQITTATTTTIVAAPGANLSRAVHGMFIRNASTTLTNQVTVEVTGNSGTNYSTLTSQYLAPGDALHWTCELGFVYVPASTTIQVPGRLLKTTTVTSGTTFTTGAATNSMRVRLMGGGGGGAGCTSVAGAASAGGGGGGGGYAEKLFAAAPNTAYTIAIGGGGAGNSGAGGSNGGNTTFTAGGVTVTANGGTGAAVATATTTLVAYAGGAGAAVSTNGDFNGVGAPGEPGVTLLVSTPIVASGSGGSSLWGDGGIGLTAVGNGNNGAGFGGGGGGAATGASTVRTGGSGAAGAIIVDEYS